MARRTLTVPRSPARAHTTGARVCVALVGTALGGLVAPTLSAQQVRVTARATPTITNECTELASSPTLLAGLPEGLALLRLKRELEGAMVTLEMQRPLQSEQVQRFSRLQRGVDSAINVIVRNVGPDGQMTAIPGPSGVNGVMQMRRSDSTRVVVNGRIIEGRPFFVTIDSVMRAHGPLTAAIVRDLQPRVAQMAIEAEAALPMRATVGGNGYIGISLSGAQMRVVSPQGAFTSHCEYPLVESVDAGSPAEKAGIASGDMVIAYNGRDLTQQAVNYPEMLVPGSTLRVRLRRGPRTREVPVTVAPRTEERTVVMMRGVPGPGGDVTFDWRAGRPAPGAVMPAMAPTGAGFNAPPSGAGIVVLLGAQFATVDEQFAESFALDAGLLVMKVPPGSPAAEAGLRPGEMVVSANGTRVRDVATLRRMLATNARELRLGVQSRATGERVVVVKLKP